MAALIRVPYRAGWAAARAAVALIALAGAACDRRPAAPPSTPAAAEPAWVARVNGQPITEAEVQQEIQRRTAARRAVGDADSLVRELVERKAMLDEAARSPALQDPAVRRELENRQLGQWLDRTLKVERDRVTVTDDELRAHFDAHPETARQPEMVRLAILYRKANPRDPAESSTALRDELQQARTDYLADPAAATQQGRLAGFGTIAARASEDTISRYRGGDLGWLTTDADRARLPAEVLAAGQALTVGGVSDVLAAGDGWYVVMKTDHRPAQTTPFAEAAPGLRRQLIRQKQEAVERDFTSNLLARARVEINPEQVSRLVIPAPVAPVPPDLRTPADRRPAAEVPTP